MVGRGISSFNLTSAQIPKDNNSVDTWWDFANPGDLYTTTPNDQAGTDITAAYLAAVRLGIDHSLIAAEIAALTGQGGLGQQVLELLTQPLIGGAALAEAITLAVNFYDTNPPGLAHVDYDTVNALPGLSSIAVAVNHLNTIAAATPPRRGTVLFVALRYRGGRGPNLRKLAHAGDLRIRARYCRRHG